MLQLSGRSRIAAAGKYALAVALCCSLVLATAGAASAQGKRRQRRAAAASRAPQARIDLAAESAALLSPDPEVASKAAARLGQIPKGQASGQAQTQAQALDALLDALALGLHPRVAAQALDAVAAHADARALDTLVFYLDHRDVAVRAAAVRALGALAEPAPAVAAHVLAALTDRDEPVRAAAMAVIASRGWRQGIGPMRKLLERGDQAAAPALAALADPELARALAALQGTVPDALLAQALGPILLRPDFGPEAARVDVVRALGKLPGPEAMAQLERYVAAQPESSRHSRQEAMAILAARRAQGGK